MESVFLRGKRLILRAPSVLDIPHMTKWINDPETRRYLSTYLPMNEEDEKMWLERLSGSRKNSDIVFVIETNEGTPIGMMGLHRIDWKNRNASTGAYIGNSEYRGKGYGTEAKVLLLKYAFDELNLFKIYSEVLDFNGRSQAYLTKTGYEVEGVRRKQIFKDGKYRDLILVAIFKKDFPKVWKKWKHLVV